MIAQLDPLTAAIDTTRARVTLDLYRACVARVGGRMAHAKPHGPRLETLLDQRDRLRLEINTARSDGRATDYDVGDLRRKLLLIEQDIIQQWEDPSA